MYTSMCFYLLVYAAAYSAASYFDLSTTVLALQHTNGHEGNAFVVNGNAYQSALAWSITAAGGLMMGLCVVFSICHAKKVHDFWLAHPVRSFQNFYINPWSKRTLTFSPLHMLSFAIAFVVLRLAAAGNNLLIAHVGIAPIGAAVDWIAHRTSPVIGFAVIIVPLFYLISMAVSPSAAKLLVALRRSAA